MKLLHIADLHIGKKLRDISLLPDQVILLEQIVTIAQRQQVDAVLIAGDIYQRATPQSEAMTVYNRFLTALVGSGIRVYAISGNHDSDQRISYFSDLIRGAGVFVSEQFSGVLQRFTLTDAFGEVTVHLLPFIRPGQVRRIYPEEKIENYTDAIETVIRHSEPDTTKRNVLLAHQYVTGAELTGEEESSVGGLDNVDGRIFDGFDYVALGHIHKPQRVGRDTLRYAGSIAKYSLSEATHKKSVTLVELGEKGHLQIEQIPLQLPHDVRNIEGLLDELMELPYSEDYLHITVHDEIVPPDARVTLSVNFPNMVLFTVENSKTKQDISVCAQESIENKTVVELFCDFFRLQNNDAMPDEAQTGLVEELAQELKEAPYEAD